MKSWITILAMGLSLWLSAPDAFATTIFHERLPCPVGGEIYTQRFRPETRARAGREMEMPFLPSPVTLSLDECDNGLVIFRSKFSDAELKTLTRLIVRPDFFKLKNAPTYHRAMWLRKQMGADQFERTVLLGNAATEQLREDYEAEPYRKAYLSALSQLPWSPERSADWLRAYLHGANMLRMSDRFDESYRLLIALSKPALLPRTRQREQAAKTIHVLTELSLQHVDSHFPVTLAETAEQAADICAWNDQAMGRGEREICNSIQIRELVTMRCWRMANGGLGRARWSDCLKDAPITLAIAPLALLLSIILLIAMFRSFKTYDNKVPIT